MQRPHLLYVAWGFPPSRGAGVYRALATANAFAAGGWDVTVLTAPREVFEDHYGSDASLEQQIHPSVKVRRVTQPLPLKEYDLAKYPCLRLASEEGWSSAVRRLQTLPFPEAPYGMWRRNLESATMDVHHRHPVDLVLGTSNPHVDFVPGWLLNRQFNTPYVMDYRDSWGLDLFTGKHATGRSSRAWRLERSMLQRAQEIWFVNHPIRDWYAKEVPPAAERMHVVANGYDGDLGAAVAAARRTTRTKGSRPVRAGHGLTFGYLGTLYGAVPLRELLEGWRTTRRSVPELENARLVLRGHLGHYDVPDAKTVELLAEFSNDGVIHGGAVPKAAVAEAYAQFDVLVLPLIAGRFITSGKVFEYAATGLPIVSIHGRESAAVTILEGYPAWVLTKSLSAPDVARALAKAARLARSATESSSAENRRWAQRYSRSRQLEPRVTALSDLVSARPSRSGRDDQVSLKPQPVTPAPVDHRPVLTRSTAWVDGRHGPQQRVILLTGGSKPADQILFDEHHSAEVDFSILLGPTNSPARLTLVCRTPPEREIVGVAEILEVAAAPHSASRAARSIRYQSVDRALRRSLPGRVLASLSPLDDARELARSTRMNQRVYAALDGSDLVVAVDRAAVRTAAQWLRQRLTPAAVYGLPAAARRAHRAG